MEGIKLEFDDKGNVILPNGENDDMPRNEFIDENDEFINVEELQEQYKEEMTSNEKEEVVNKPKLSKSGTKGGVHNVHRAPTSQIIEEDFTVESQSKPTRPNISDPLKALVIGAKRTEHKINFDISIESIDKNLFSLLSNSYPDDKEKIIDIILNQNLENINKIIKQQITSYYGNIE